jgi:hypothetical protein
MNEHYEEEIKEITQRKENTERQFLSEENPALPKKSSSLQIRQTSWLT